MKDKKKDFNYHEPAFVCSHIFENTRPVLLVCKEDGDWQFLCGQDDHSEEELPRVIGIGHLFDRDPTLMGLLDLNDDWEAERVDELSNWEKTKI